MTRENAKVKEKPETVVWWKFNNWKQDSFFENIVGKWENADDKIFFLFG